MRFLPQAPQTVQSQNVSNKCQSEFLERRSEGLGGGCEQPDPGGSSMGGGQEGGLTNTLGALHAITVPDSLQNQNILLSLS